MEKIGEGPQKFAAANKTLTFFLLSMCRVFIDKVSEDKIVAEKDLSQESLQLHEYSYLLKDAFSDKENV